MKRLFIELVEIELYKTLEQNPNENLSIQAAINNVLEYLKGSELVCPRRLSRKKLKFPDGLARYISQYFIDQNTERYLKLKFRPLPPRTNDDDTLGFNEWSNKLAKTSKQRRNDRKLLFEQRREERKHWLEQLNQQEQSEKEDKKGRLGNEILY